MKPQAPGQRGDKPLAVELRERLRGLPPAQAVLMRQVIRLHAPGDRVAWSHYLMQVAHDAPDHPEVLHWLGLLHMEEGAWSLAASALGRAAEQRSEDFSIWCALGSAQCHDNDPVGARNSLGHAARCARNAPQWLKLSLECDRQGLFEEALHAANAAVGLDPHSAVALLQRSRCNKVYGHTEAAATDCRTLIATGREEARAWFALLDLKTVVLTELERRQLEAVAARPGVPAAERLLLDFALGKALEDAGCHERALEVFRRANDAVRAGAPWDRAGFARRVADGRAAFEDSPVAQAAPQGREVIFIVGMPRSGSTLVEQVLAAHPAVEGASELPYVHQVIAAESRRRGRAFPMWVSQASADDWTRMGQHYLQLSARWRLHKPTATDKLPDNWLYVGAIRAMLPEARIIDCRRDPLETCWSCYKQLFGPGLATFSYGFESLAQYWEACEHSGDRWARRHPQHVRRQSYEALVGEPAAQIAELLAFCQLPFDSACLNFHSAERAIRTPSALQVRQPMRQASTPAASFGSLLEPLRSALECARSSTSY
jgi:tetratricopeptide (TPR) repeat protein